MKYALDFDSAAIRKKFLKALRKINARKTQDAIMDAVKALQETPRPFGTKPFKQLNPPVDLYRLTAAYRIRIGRYRVLYDVDDKNKKVWIIALRRRRENTYA